MMNLEQLKMSELLPEFMTDDLSNTALSEAIDKVVHDAVPKISVLSKWDKIDVMSDDELDDLAEHISIPWYETDATVQTKRQVIKDAYQVFRSLGTLNAVSLVINAYFGTHRIYEWFDYGGKPGFFCIVVSSSGINTSTNAKIMRLLDLVKRESIWLDYLTLGFSVECDELIGIGYHESVRETIKV